MTLFEILTQSANITRNSGVTVKRSNALSTVSFYQDGKSFAFLQGDEADQFNAECERTWEEVQFLGMDVVELAMAEPYLILLEG